MAIFTFCPGANVPATMPRDGGSSTVMSLGGWQFSSRPTTPYQRKFKLTLHGLRWYTNTDGTYDFTTNVNFNARALERFYETNELWNPFTLPHQHFGDLTVRFSEPLTVPPGIPNSGGKIAPFDVTFIHHNPGF